MPKGKGYMERHQMSYSKGGAFKSQPHNKSHSLDKGWKGAGNVKDSHLNSKEGYRGRSGSKSY